LDHQWSAVKRILVFKATRYDHCWAMGPLMLVKQ
jgi:hypothetical protein